MAFRGQQGMCHALDRRQWVGDGASLGRRRRVAWVLRYSNRQTRVGASQRDITVAVSFTVYKPKFANSALATLVGRIRSDHRASVLMIRARSCPSLAHTTSS